MNFENKVALVTGGTSGIGLAVATQLAEKGAKLVIAGRNKEKGERALAELTKIHSDIIYLSIDVANSSDVKDMVAKTISTFGHLDFAFNNAANDEITLAPTHEFEEADFDKLIGVTLKSVWLCMKYELQAFVESNSRGSIVNTSSLDALLCSAGTAVYAAGKSGGIALTKSIAQEYGTKGIRINAVSPGAIRTPLLEKKFQGLPQDQAEHLENTYSGLNALQRIGTADEVASVVTWLFSDASSYITGQNIVIDGGVAFIKG